MISFRDARRHLIEPLDPSDRAVFVASPRAYVPTSSAADVTFSPTGNYVLYVQAVYITQQENSYYEIYNGTEKIYEGYRVPLYPNESWNPPWRGVKTFRISIYNLSDETKDYDCRIKGWVRPIDNHLFYERKARIRIRIPPSRPIENINRWDITDEVMA